METIAPAMSEGWSLRGLAGRSLPEAAKNGVCTSLGLICITRIFDLRSSARQHSVMP